MNFLRPSGLCLLDGQRTNNNATTQDGKLENDKRHALVIRVVLPTPATVEITVTLRMLSGKAEFLR